MIKAIVAGAGGRMGSRIVALLREARDFTLVGAVEHPQSPAVGQDAGEVAGIGDLGVAIGDSFEKVAGDGQVFFDFTAPEAARRHIEVAAGVGLAGVVGTTGLTAADLDRARALATRSAFVISPNMSVGVNVVYTLLERAARVLGDDYDIEIFEVHHHFKKDAPSGTALKMAQVIAKALGRDLDKVGVYGRKGIVGERSREEIAVHTLRAGDVVGEHTVVFGGMGERIEITHRAHSRDNFGRGALRAARWIVGQKAGLYDMLDVLGLK